MDESGITEESPASPSGNDDLIDVNEDGCIVLLEISFKNYAFITIGVPILALIIAFSLGFLLDYQQISDYDWTCGVSTFISFKLFSYYLIERED